jgi:hypothetical protein
MDICQRHRLLDLRCPRLTISMQYLGAYQLWTLIDYLVSAS